MAAKEPPWLAATYSYVGLAIIFGAICAAYFVISEWPLFLGIGLAGFGLWYFTRSPQARERQARDRTTALLDRLASIDAGKFPEPEDFATNIGAALIDGGDDDPKPPQAVLRSLMDAAEELYRTEGFSSDAVGPSPPAADSIEGARYYEKLQKQHQKLADPAVFETVCETIYVAFKEWIDEFPPALLQPRRELMENIDGHTPPALFTVPLAEMLPHVGKSIGNLAMQFYNPDVHKHGVFADLRDQLDRNLDEASGNSPGKDKPRILPAQYDGDDPVSAYLHHTPLEDIFSAEVPFPIPEQLRFEHMHVLAGSGHGKTQTLQHLIVSDLTRPDPPSLVVIDSQGDMIEKISRLALFDPENGPLASRLIVINPADVENPPALNMFDVNLNRLGRYNAGAREQILNGVIELYDYMFGSLLDAELTSKQSVIFRYIARLMLAIPGATINDLLKLLTDATPYMQYVAKLPPGARMFFETEFPQRSFADTKQQIQRRLWGILENPTLERMLTAPKNRIDMFDALNSGKIVLVNTAKDFLKAERSSFLGRLFIALTLQAALERAALPENRRRPAFLYIDEAADYFDDNIDDLLTQARKYKLGVIFSHQYLDQLAPGLHSSIAANTSIKFGGGVSDRDARSVAADMRTTPTFILEQHKKAQATRFAAYFRNHTPTALSLSIPFGSLERQARMGNDAYRRLQDENAARVSMKGAARNDHPPDPSAPLDIPRRDRQPARSPEGDGPRSTPTEVASSSSQAPSEADWSS